MKLPSYRAVAEALVGWTLFLGGMSLMWYIDVKREAGHIKTIQDQGERNLLYLAAPLYECREGNKWLGIEIWLEEHPDCDWWCAYGMLMEQAGKQVKPRDSNARVAEK